MSTNRGSKSAREKASKSTHVQNGKTDTAASGGKYQPTAEQLRIAQLTSSDAEPDTKRMNQINQVAELTGRSEDEAATALHDCDYDINRAVEVLLERQGDQAEEWQEIGKKKKAAIGGKGYQVGSSGENTADVGTGRTTEVIAPVEQERVERDRGGESIPRGRRERTGPPRFQRGRGGYSGGTNGEKGGSSVSRERPPFESGRGGRRRGGSNVGGGRTYAGRGFSSGRNNFESGPQIDTWTNEKTVNGERNEAPMASDWGEDWTNDEWSGSLEESRVFTASTSLAGSTVYSADNSSAAVTSSSSLFDPATIGSQVYVASSTSASSRTPGSNVDGVGSMLPDASSGNVYRSNALQSGSMGGHESLTSGSILEHYPELSAAYLSRYKQEATEVIKNAVGIGNTAIGTHAAVGIDQLNLPTSQSPSCGAASTAKQQRPRLPPPSKIPASAVEMPASMNSAQLDVQFGNWDPPTAVSSSPPDNTLSFTADVTPAQAHYAANVHSMAQPSSGLHGSSNMSSYEMSVSRSALMSGAVSDTSKSSLLSLEDLAIGSTGSKSSASTSYQSGANVPKDFVNSKLQMASGQQGVQFPSSQADRKPGAYQSQAQQQVTSQPQPSMAPQLQFSQVGGTYSAEAPSTSSVYKTAASSAGAVPAFSSQQINQYASSFTGYAGADASSAQFSTYSGPAAPGFGPQPQALGGAYGVSQGQGAYTGTTHMNASGKSYGASGSVATDKQQSSSSAYPASGHGQQSYDVSNSYQIGSGQLPGGSGYQLSGSGSYQGSQLPYQSVSYQSTVPGYESGSAQAANAGYGTGHSYSPNLYPRQGREAAPTAGSYPNASDVASGNIYQRVSQAYSNANQQQQQQPSTQAAVSVATPGKPLVDSLAKLSVKDTSSAANAGGQYDAVSATSSATPASLSTATTTTSSAGVGLLSATTTAASRPTSSTVTTTKSATPLTSKAMVNMPVGGPAAVMNNYMIAQPPGFQLATFGYPAPQQPVTYTFEDLQLLQQQQQRFQMPYAYDVPFQPATTMTGRDATASLTAQNYAAGADTSKLAPIDPMSPVAIQPAQPQGTVAAQPVSAVAQQQQQQQQSYLNPAAMHPAAAAGYSYYYPSAAGIMPVGSYYAPMIQMGGMAVPLATNPAHGVTTATTQYQKAAMYGSHAGYNVGGQTQDFTKAFGSSQTGNKAPVVAGGTGAATSDVLTGGSSFSKNHVQTYDKGAFHSGTPPPPFNMAMPSAAQTGAALSGGYGGPYMPMMPHQSHSTQILHHPMSQDASMAGRGSVPQNATQQPKAGTVNKTGAYSSPYWGAN